MQDLSIPYYFNLCKDLDHFYIQTAVFGLTPSLDSPSSPRMPSSQPGHFATGFHPVIRRYNKGAVVSEFNFATSFANY
jgi:hypothetical protein